MGLGLKLLNGQGSGLEHDSGLGVAQAKALLGSHKYFIYTNQKS